MLTHSNNIIAFPSCTVIYHSSLHSRTKWANWILLHALLRSLNYCIWFYEIWHINLLHILNKRLRFIFINLWVNCYSSNIKFNRCNWLKIFQYVNQCQWIFTSTDCYQNSISIFYHFKFLNCSSYLWFYYIWNIN